MDISKTRLNPLRRTGTRSGPGKSLGGLRTAGLLGWAALCLFLLPAGARAQCGLLPMSFHPSENATSGISPGGWVLTDSPPAGFWDASISGAVSYLYSSPLSGTYAGGDYLWSTSWGWSGYLTGPAMVQVTLGYSNSDGSGFTALASDTEDVNVQTTFNLSTGPLTLSNQCLVVEVQFGICPGGSECPGLNSDMTLTTPIGYTAGCSCSMSSTIIDSGIEDKILHYNDPSTPPPDGWTGWGYDDSAWGNAVTWTHPTGAPLAGTSIPWFTYVSGGYGIGPSYQDYEVIRRDFTLPACAVSVTGELMLESDDNTTSYINGNLIQADPTNLVTQQVERIFALPEGSFRAGGNALAIANYDALASYVGYSYRLIVVWTCGCPSPTGTPATATNTMTPGASFTATPTPTVTFTPTGTGTATGTDGNGNNGIMLDQTVSSIQTNIQATGTTSTCTSSLNYSGILTVK